MSGSSLTSCILHLMFFCWQIFNLVLYQNCHSVRYSCFMENWYPKDLTHDRIILALLLQTDNTNRVSEFCSLLNIALPHRWWHLEHFSKHYHFLIHIKPSALFYNSLACWSVTDRLASLAKPHCHLALLWTKCFYLHQKALDQKASYQKVPSVLHRHHQSDNGSRWGPIQDHTGITNHDGAANKMKKCSQISFAVKTARLSDFSANAPCLLYTSTAVPHHKH